MGEGQDVGLGHQGDLPGEAAAALGRGEAAERAVRRAAAGQLEGVAERPLDAGAGVHRRLDRDLLRRPLPQEPAGADVEVLVVLADDDHVDVVGPLAADRALDPREQADGAEVDVLVEVEPEAQQDPFLQDARGHPGMADGTQQDGVDVAQLADRPVGQDLAGPQITLAADVDRPERVVQALQSGDLRQHFQALGDDFRPDPVTRHNPDLDQVRPPRHGRRDRSRRTAARPSPIKTRAV